MTPSASRIKKIAELPLYRRENDRDVRGEKMKLVGRG